MTIDASPPADPDPRAPQALTPPLMRSPLRAAVSRLTRVPEPASVTDLMPHARMAGAESRATQALALRIARGVRERARQGGRAGLVQGLLQEFALSSQEGVALMCLAEALLRIPDAPTRDALIRDKIARGNWHEHLGRSPSLFVNAAAWGLLLTGTLVSTHSDNSLSATLRRALARGGEPLIRKGVDMAMRMMGEQFVTGETIEQALAHARSREAAGFRYSYDMLGEAALTAADAERYVAAYQHAIGAIGAAAGGRGVLAGPGISLKLSALHPRYARSQVERVRAELYPRLLELATLARHHDIALNIDAEESERLELSLDLLERLCFEPALNGWQGIGFVVQTYQKRCAAVVDVLIDLARRSGHRLMIRLVKGAYWDSEIKRAQIEGQQGYTVYTRKPYSDVAYLACARRLLAAPDAVFPQFATHNAQTLAAVHTIAGEPFEPARYEYQCLHGMGEPLYERVVRPVAEGGLARPCRIYAPVGTYDTLLAYLVRRLLENGANSSFVNRIADDDIALEDLVEDPVSTVQKMAQREGPTGLPHPRIPAPSDLYAPERTNSLGIDLGDEATLDALGARLHEALVDAAPVATPLLASDPDPQDVPLGARPREPLRNPAQQDEVVGHVVEATLAEVDTAVAAARDAMPSWTALGPAGRAAILETAAQALQDELPALLPLLVREAGKTWANATAEVREAVDFLRYYATQVRESFDPATHVPLGPVVCISPWNFPLAIFLGQIAAALAAGNTVLAKPAEQTPLVAARAVRLLHAAGVPRAALQLLPGRGETIGASLVADARVEGVLFTGSIEVARILQRTLAARLGAHGGAVALVAETGGLNAMVVDSSALAEQAVADIVTSAFDSAGQRCSALRLLCVQDDVADRVIGMIEGAMQELRIGDPRHLSTDCGPVIDAEAQASIEGHVQAMALRGCRTYRVPLPADLPERSSFVAPTLIEIARVEDLEREVFGPVLHVLRFARESLDDLLGSVNATGYGLTQGVHTRIDETVAQVIRASRAGNLYVNRNIVGAVVGVQPFGGEGLSGTGPKAGGPLYLLRLLSRRPEQAARLAVAARGRTTSVPVHGFADSGLDAHAEVAQALDSLREWALQRGLDRLAAHCLEVVAASPVGPWRALPGPTGEANLYAVAAHDATLCLAGNDEDLLFQLCAVLAVGSHAVWASQAVALRERLPPAVRERIRIAQDWQSAATVFGAVIQHAGPDEALKTSVALAARPGPIVGLTVLTPGQALVPLERLVVERALSINTAAAGGNASLMTLGDGP
jgi:RHH-type proline utilization regulon transcriptional repressor/proline dehydrogenase/delta 1-pyrroline-5-carboxylate dehydrogenase